MNLCGCLALGQNHDYLATRIGLAVTALKRSNRGLMLIKESRSNAAHRIPGMSRQVL
jgi:hypothetical protein